MRHALRVSGSSLNPGEFGDKGRKLCRATKYLCGTCKLDNVFRYSANVLPT